MENHNLRKWTGWGFLFLLVNSAYIWAFASPTVFYMGNVLVHLFLGTGLFGAFLVSMARE
jgi:hypothetical protein